MEEKLEAVNETVETIAEEANDEGLLTKVASFGKANVKYIVIGTTVVVVVGGVVKFRGKIAEFGKSVWSKTFGKLLAKKNTEVVDADIVTDVEA